jgi:HlyD family secretion protein
MNKKRKITIAAIAAAALSAASWWTPLPEKLGLRQAKSEDISLYGNIDIRQVELALRVPGRLNELRLEEGETVRAGDVLARLDARSYQDSMRAAEAEVARRSAALGRLQAGSRPAEIAQARARVSEQQADLDNLRLTLARNEALVRSGATTQAAYDNAKTAAQVAGARLDSATKAFELTRQGPRAEDIAEADAALKVAQANLAAAQTALADTELLAPSDGVILSRVRERGAIVGAGDVVYVLSLQKPIWARVYVSESLLGRVHPGMEVSVFTDSRPGQPYRGRIGFISPVAEFTPKTVETPELRTDLVYRVRVIVEGEGNGLRQDMPVTVRLPNSAEH